MYRVRMGQDKTRRNRLCQNGMCQYGMKYLGELGYGYQEILGYYYPRAQVTRLKGFEE